MASSNPAADHQEGGGAKQAPYETGIPGLRFSSYDTALFVKVAAIMAAITLGAFVAAHAVHALRAWFGIT